MEAAIAHLQDNAIIYGVGAVFALPLIYLTRKYSVPAVLYALEFAIYAVAIHIATHLLVRVTRWFKESSSMQALREDGKPMDTPEWGTPLMEFWLTEEYDPNWLWKVEVVFLVIALILMWRYRPMKVQRRSGRKTQAFVAESKGRAGGKPGAYKGAGRGKGGGFRPPRGR